MLPETLHVPAAVLFLVGGVLSCFLGQRTFRIVLGLYGFVVGVLVAGSLIGPADTTRDILLLIGGGIGGALALVLAYFIGVALIGAAFAALAVHAVAAQFGMRATGDARGGVHDRRCAARALDATLRHRGGHGVRRRLAARDGRARSLASRVGHRPGRRPRRAGRPIRFAPRPARAGCSIVWLLLAIAGLVAQFRLLHAPHAARLR